MIAVFQVFRGRCEGGVGVGVLFTVPGRVGSVLVFLGGFLISPILFSSLFVMLIWSKKF